MFIYCVVLKLHNFYSDWNDDWKPGKYPKTEEEKVAAAKRYGLLREDYEPYPDDGMGYGDYPKIDIVSAECRDPYEDFDFPAHNRNYGEVVSEEQCCRVGSR